MGIFGNSEREKELQIKEEKLRQDQTNLDSRRVDLESQQRILTEEKAALKREQDAFEREKKAFKTSSANARNKIAEEKGNILEDAKAWMEKERQAFEAEKKDFYDSSAKTYQQIEKKQGELEARKRELLELEAKAKNNYVKSQNEAFNEIITTHFKSLEEQKTALEAIIAKAEDRIRKANKKEGEIAKRELAVTEREQQAEAGFADRVSALASEAKKEHEVNLAQAAKLKNEKEQIAKKRNELKAYEETLREREDAIRNAEQDRDNGYTKERALVDKELAGKREECAREIANLQKKCGDEIAAKHSECNQAIAEKQKKAQTEYDKAAEEIARYKEKELEKIETEIAKIRDQRLKTVTDAENRERDRIKAEIVAERQAFEKEKSAAEALLHTQQVELEKQKGTLLALESELAGKKQKLEADEARLEKEEDREKKRLDRRKEMIDDEVAEKVNESCAQIKAELDACKKVNENLLGSIRDQSELIGLFETLKKQLGDREPSDVISLLNKQQIKIEQLNEELLNRPKKETLDENEILKKENETLKETVKKLNKQITSDSEKVKATVLLQRTNSELLEENKSLQQKAELFEGQANQAMDELKRLRAAYERPAEVEARYKEIELPYLIWDKVSRPEKLDDPASVNEIKWLDGIIDKCEQYGLHFNPRIVKAFHTALKTAEWSPLTVLAGVSGTGKSELPRLYSHFGGLFFEPLSVQPNWDSQESMLGFFNSIDNKFDAQPVLRFLAQSQKPWTDDYPGLKDAVCMVLLDEMNLAHPELYFAEFLSKLELRRGMKKTDIPSLPVKIGAGLKPYDLELGRNVLWTGTMNQDETTKSLSDKVLDRSIVIYFPRPTELKRRLKLKQLDQKNRGKILHWTTWKNWLEEGSSFSDAEVKPYKKFIEGMNESLGVVGRAIGHRVWQSVEYYMANYPDVRAAKEKHDKTALEQAMHIAFEDQLVQKVMPKLRGIDTEGDSLKMCLDKIEGQLQEGVNGQSFNLVADFELAKKLGYGQFMWQSANYLKEADAMND